MSNSDKSASARTQLLRNRTLANYYVNNPNTRESATNTTFDASTQAARATGQQAFTVQNAMKPNTVYDACCITVNWTTTECFSGPIGNFSYTLDDNFVSPYLGRFFYRYTCTWDAIPGATSFSLSVDGNGGEYYEITSSTSGTLYSVTYDALGNVILTATIPQCPSLTAFAQAPCFLAGSLVTMYDGTTKPIECIEIGDALLGAFGEYNTVLALHRPLLGDNTMTRINEHSTSSHHPHIGADRKFYAAKPAVVDAKTYGKYHEVIESDGQKAMRYLEGLRPGRTQELHLGVYLKTVEGAREVTHLETYNLPADTQLYNLVMDGSHTYHVDGYAVTGWPNEKDFDYDNWVSIRGKQNTTP